MLSNLPFLIRVPLALLLVAANLLLHATPLLLLALVKVLLPFAAARRPLSRWLVTLAESWIAGNSALIALFTRTEFQVEGVAEARREGWFLVIANHQSWVDIPVLQRTFNRRIPFLKFFLKQQLIWVPVLGLAWWALDYPFMRRYTRAEIEADPSKRGKDIEATRKACARFRELPVSVMNFVEGTRYSESKATEQDSPYAGLLRPRAGGIAFVLQAMGDVLQSALDVTIVYPAGRPTVMDLIAGRIPRIRVAVRELPIPAELIGGDYANDAAVRERVQTWINGLWAEKSTLIARLTRE
jgi:1-acyl-sn-glycerol-3-phosphate acyltransferase